MLKHIVQFLSIVLVTSLVTSVYWLLYGKPAIGIDDANIYFVYVKNFASGYGFVYNVGGERVEGFTSMLWVLLVTPFIYFGKDFENIVLLLNVVIISEVFYVSINFINRISNQRHFFSIPAFLFITLLTVIPGYIDWTILTLMETGLWSLLLVSITTLLCKKELSARVITVISGLLFLLVLTRPESLMIGLLFIGLLVARIIFNGDSLKRSLIKGFIPFMAFIISIVALIGFRMWYFGYPLPNTFYAKVSGNWLNNFIDGIYYLIFCVFQSPLLIVILIGLIYSLILLTIKVWRQLRRKEKIYLDESDQIQFVLTSVSLISILIPVNLGGDHFKLLRFYQPYFPIYYFSLLHLLFWQKYIVVSFKMPGKTYLGYLTMATFVPFIYLMSQTPLHTYLKNGSLIVPEFDLAEIGREEGKQMGKLFSSMPKSPAVGVSAAGGFAYGYTGYTYDLLGLNNVEMAHSKGERVGVKNHAAFNKEVFYKQAPDIFHGYKKTSLFVASMNDTILYENEPHYNDDAFASKMYKNIFKDENFKKHYKPVIIKNPQHDLYLKTYCNTNYIALLKDKGYTVKVLKSNEEVLH